MYIYIIYRYISISTVTYSDKDLPGRRAAIGASCEVWDNDGTIERRRGKPSQREQIHRCYFRFEPVQNQSRLPCHSFNRGWCHHLMPATFSSTGQWLVARPVRLAGMARPLVPSGRVRCTTSAPQLNAPLSLPLPVSVRGLWCLLYRRSTDSNAPATTRNPCTRLHLCCPCVQAPNSCHTKQQLEVTSYLLG